MTSPVTIPIQIKFLNMRRLASLEREIAGRVEELQSLHGRLVGCHVSVEVPHRHHQSGNSVEVRIALALPGELVVTRKTSSEAAPATAVHQAFDALKRQMRKVTGKRIAARKRSNAKGVASAAPIGRRR
jgi:ribosome-associated translation inhibitor RaiA